jgi:ABC-type glycerol-3-phosphate transport system substrate-binding protein
VTADQPRLLRVWLPPQFDPQAETPAADLLKARMQAFEEEHPGIELEIRVKSETDILKILSVTNNAAPDAMPDLIAMSYSDMQAAASAGFLHPLEGLTPVLQDPDWYAFARELGHLKNIEYGIPFASDVLVTVYRPVVFEQLPSTWDEVLTSGSPLAFPASDPKVLFSFSLYLSAGGRFVDDQGALALDENTLIRLLSFYKQAIESGTIGPTVRDQQTDAQSLQVYREGRADLAVVWASSDIQTRSGGYLPLLGLNDTHYALGDGWVWASAGSDVADQPLAAELAVYLVESSFMSEWTRAAGVLPTRPQALNGWEDEELRTSLNEVLQTAHPLPSEDIVSIVGPLLQGALVRILNGDQPESVARSVIEEIK